MDFNPLTATQAELTFYGFPERPSDAKDLAIFDDEFSPTNYRGEMPASTAPMCVEPGSEDSTASWQSLGGSVEPLTGEDPEDSYTRAGIADENVNNYNYVYARLTQPTATNCSGADAHSTWVGLGGLADQTGLLQNGTESGNFYGSAGLNAYAWWQAIWKQSGNGGNIIDNTGTVLVPNSDLSVTHGDEISMSTHYWPASGTNPSKVDFYFHNLTTGVVDPVEATIIDGNPVSDYYAGGSADVFDERPYNTMNEWIELREMTQTNWTNAVTSNDGTSNTQDLRTGDRLNNTMINLSPSVTLETTTPGSTTEDLTDTWKNCGTVGA